MPSDWKFNTPSLNEKNFTEQELIQKQELTCAIIGNRRWWKLKGIIRSFIADYSRRHKLDILAAHRELESKIDRAVKAGDSGN